MFKTRAIARMKVYKESMVILNQILINVREYSVVAEVIANCTLKCCYEALKS